MYPMRKYVVLCGLLTSMFLLFSVQAQPPGKTSPTPVPPSTVVKMSSPVGIAGCSGGNCHGRAIPDKTPALAHAETDAWKCAYNHWLSYDNHAKAYKVLLDERARDMMVRLSGQGTTMLNELGQVTEDPESAKETKLTIPVRVSYKKEDGSVRFDERRATFDKEPWQVLPNETDAKGLKFDLIGPAKYHFDATQESRCLACHVNPTLAVTPVDPDARKNVERHRLQGVGCEACHGNGSSWRDSHVNWPDGEGKPKLYKDSGMVWLNDPVSRARACAGCHVGAPPDKTYIPDKLYSPVVRNMNHDMIAAGHPRLNFEYNTYQALETPHWIERDRTQDDPGKRKVTVDADFHGRNWLIGRSVQMEKSIALMAYRSRPEPPNEFTLIASLEAEADAITQGKQAHYLDPWPELAEFNCYGCHQSLDKGFYPLPPKGFPIKEQLTTPADRLFSNLSDSKTTRPLGSWVWDPLFSTARVFNRPTVENKAIDAFLELQTAIQMKQSREKIHAAALKALDLWEGVTESLSRKDNYHRKDREPMLLQLPTQNPKRIRWDDMAQTYLGLRAFNNNQPIGEIEEKLMFPYDDEGHRQDSPQRYGLRKDETPKKDELPPPFWFDGTKARSEFRSEIAPKK